MKASRYIFSLDLHEAQSQICLVATEGDTNRELVISLSDGGEPYSIDKEDVEKTSVDLLIERPNGETIVEKSPILSEDGSTVTYRFTGETCAFEGMHDCQLVFYGEEGSDQVLWSPRFNLYVNKKKQDRMM